MNTIIRRKLRKDLRNLNRITILNRNSTRKYNVRSITKRFRLTINLARHMLNSQKINKRNVNTTRSRNINSITLNIRFRRLRQQFTNLFAYLTLNERLINLLMNSHTCYSHFTTHVIKIRQIIQTTNPLSTNIMMISRIRQHLPFGNINRKYPASIMLPTLSTKSSIIRL